MAGLAPTSPVRAALAAIAALAAVAVVSSASGPLIIAHRGASGYRPEHTLEGYRLAAEMGADFIEPDLVPTKDGVLIARHENEIGGTTDVATKFPDRKRTKTIDGRQLTGYFSEDFTLEEVRTLHATERLPFRNHEFDGRFAIPTFDEVANLAEQLSKELGHPIGIYPETKHPSYFRSIGLPLEDRLLTTLQAHGWDRADAPVFIQSFETANLQALRPRTKVRLIQLIDEREGPWDRKDAARFKTVADLTSDAGFREIAGYANGVGLNHRLVVPANPDGTTKPASDIVARAHKAGLLVHLWTLRRESMFLSPSYGGEPEREFKLYASLGVDGIFTDFTDIGVRALR